MLHHLPNNFCGNAVPQQNQQLRVSEINACYCSGRASLSLSARVWLCFYLQAAVSSRSLRTSLRNPIKMTDYILSPQVYLLREIYKFSLVMWKKAEIWGTINLAWYAFYSKCVGTTENCNLPATLQQNKTTGQLIYITADAVSHDLSPILVLFLLCQEWLPDANQAWHWCLGPLTLEQPVSPLTFVIIQLQHCGTDNQGIKAGQEKSSPQT